MPANKNCSGSSSATMEVDILIRGFNSAESKHGLRYVRVIGDGDTSVVSSIKQFVPVWGNMETKGGMCESCHEIRQRWFNEIHYAAPSSGSQVCHETDTLLAQYLEDE